MCDLWPQSSSLLGSPAVVSVRERGKGVVRIWLYHATRRDLNAQVPMPVVLHDLPTVDLNVRNSARFSSIRCMEGFSQRGASSFCELPTLILPDQLNSL